MIKGETVILTADYHTHTPYSHGKNTILENAEQARALGLQAIGIADHGFAHVTYGIRRRQVEAYRKECQDAVVKTGIGVLVGIEANILSLNGKTDLKEKDFDSFDFYLCGKHIFVRYRGVSGFFQYGFRNFFAGKEGEKAKGRLIEDNTKAYINTIKNNPIDAITHLNYCCVSNSLEVAKCAADYGTYIELNSKKRHLTDEELSDIVAKTSARFIIGSDAHARERVGDTRLVEEQLARIDFPMDRIDNIDGRLPKFRFAEYKTHR
jgi:putative hydrolase